MAEDSSSSAATIIVNRKTEKVIDHRRTVSEKVEQVQRNYYPGSNVPVDVQQQKHTSFTSTSANLGSFKPQPFPSSSFSSASSTPDSGTGSATTDHHGHGHGHQLITTSSEEYISRRSTVHPSNMTETTETAAASAVNGSPPNSSSAEAASKKDSESSETNAKNTSNNSSSNSSSSSSSSTTVTTSTANANISTSAAATTTSTSVPENAQLISRTTNQVQTQQVKTITKVYTTREIRHIGPDGLPVADQPPYSETTTATTTTAAASSAGNDYTNFPGPREGGGGNSSAVPTSNGGGNVLNEQYSGAQFAGDSGAHTYSNTNFHQQQQQQAAQNLMAPSPSPAGSGGSTANTGSTATFTTAGGPAVQPPRPMQYDPYARNSQIGYGDYSNFNNYQDLGHLEQAAGHHPHHPQQHHHHHQGASPQPPVRRHIMSAQEMADGGAGNFVQYGYTGSNPGAMAMASAQAAAAAAAAAIYGNFDGGPPEGYLDRRSTFDDHSPYGQMMARGGPPSVSQGQGPAMYEDAESAYQHIAALQHHHHHQQQQQQQAGSIMDPAAVAFFQNGMLPGGGGGGGTTSGQVTGVPPSRALLAAAGGMAPGSQGVVTAIGADGVRWRDPDLHEVIDFLAHPNPMVRANAAAYLQHLCFMDDSMKAKTRALGGVPALVSLLAPELAPELQRNACGALRNLSYGRANDENKRAIRAAGGIGALVRLLRKTPDSEIRELVTSVLWNLSSCEELKRAIIDEALGTLVAAVIIPHSGWDRAQQQQQNSANSNSANPAEANHIYWSTVFRNASGVLRNVSSAGSYARNKLRDVPGLVDSLLYLVRAAIGKNDMDNKSVENCVCVLRNLSYRCQEVVDLNYDKNPPGASSSGTSMVTSPSSSVSSSGLAAASAGSGGGGSSNLGQSPASTLSPSSSNSSKNSTSSLMGGIGSKVGENLSCFGGSKKHKSKSGGGLNSSSSGHDHGTLSPSASVHGLESRTANLSLNGRTGETPTGRELLWQTEVVQPYLALLSECSNPETLEAAAGAIQNLAACYWQPSIDIRGAVRKEKGLPILVELLRMEVDRVVCAVATALRNLAMDTRNKELIGKYALKDLVSKLPTPSATAAGNTSVSSTASGGGQGGQGQGPLPLETGTSDDTVAAVLATLNEVIARNADFAKSLVEAGGMARLTLITRHRSRFSPRVVKFTSQLLYNMWQHTELREVYRKAGYKEAHFIVSSTTARSQSASGTGSGGGTLRNGPSGGGMTPSASQMLMTPSSPTNGTLPGSGHGLYHSISANNTLSRPMSTVGGTKYEDHHQVQQMAAMRAANNGGGGTLPRPGTAASQMVHRGMPEEMLMSEMAAAHHHHQQQQQMLQAQLDSAAASMMVANGGGSTGGGGTLVRPPIGGVPIFPPGAAPGEPVYAQVNRERKRQQQQAAAAAALQQQQQHQQHQHNSPAGSTHSPVTHHPSGIGAPPVAPGSGGHQVLLDPTTNEPIYPKSMPAGDSWV